MKVSLLSTIMIAALAGNVKLIRGAAIEAGIDIDIGDQKPPDALSNALPKLLHRRAAHLLPIFNVCAQTRRINILYTNAWNFNVPQKNVKNALPLRCYNATSTAMCITVKGKYEDSGTSLVHSYQLLVPPQNHASTDALYKSTPTSVKFQDSDL
ncbi:hypothetical protein BDZ91DRAFT_789280 [Kalaharituber pfeilii]|nr:hypothetical protein BDZ91DRAFT_789280 [Kalaharituber pfeilii]